jgi:hypothetical protein
MMNYIDVQFEKSDILYLKSFIPEYIDSVKELSASDKQDKTVVYFKYETEFDLRMLLKYLYLAGQKSQ